MNQVPWVDDNVEYVGLDDEDPVSDSSDCELDLDAYLVVDDLMDRIRQLCMNKMFLRRKIGRELEGKILPNVMKELNERSRGLKYMWTYSHKDGIDTEMLGEVEGVTRDILHWRHTVDLQDKCRRWQVTGLPCTHALCIITTI